MNLDKDIDTMMKYMGVLGTVNNVPGRLILDLPSMFDNQMVTAFSVSNKQATIKASQWPDLAKDSVIIVGGTSYKVVSVKLIDDGLMKIVELK